MESLKGTKFHMTRKKYEELSNFLEQLHNLEVVCFATTNGELHMTKSMIDDCIIELIK